MKIFISFFIIYNITTTLISCNQVRREPGRGYMPDMVFSRAVETYSSTQALEKEGVFYNRLPVAGTVARGDMPEFGIKKDVGTDTANYFASKNIINPISTLTNDETKEAERLYLVNCGICHGAKLDGNGPLWKGGDGPYPAAPRNFLTDPVVTHMPSGQMYYSVTYGKNLMGSYASQLSTKQRWMVIAYIKNKQAGPTTIQNNKVDIVKLNTPVKVDSIKMVKK